jgi:hypothetical protein
MWFARGSPIKKNICFGGEQMLLTRREAMAGSGGLALLTGRPPFAIFYDGGRVAAGPACGLARRR